MSELNNKASSFADDLLKKLAAVTGQNLEKTASDNTENVAVNAEEEVQITSEAEEKNMDQIQETAEAAATPETAAKEAVAEVEETATVETEGAQAPAKEEKPEEGKAEEKSTEKSDEKPEAKPEDGKKDEKPGEKKDGQLKPEQKSALEEAVKAVEACQDPACKAALDALKSAFPFLGKETVAEVQQIETTAPVPPVAEAATAIAAAPAEAPEGDLAAAPACGVYANLVATLDKKASVGDSVWMIKDSKSNQEFASFNIKAAFGEHIDTDEVRSAYATSEEFGKAVVASFAANKVHDVLSTTAAVLQVVAHYSPEWAGTGKFKDNPKSSHSKASGEGDVTTDKNLIPEEGKKAQAAANEAIAKKAEYNVPGVTENGEIPSDKLLLDGADNRSEKVSNNTEESAHAKNSIKVEEETDRKLIASYEDTIKKQASEKEALLKQIDTLKTEAAIKEKSAKVKECVALMCNKGFIKADEQVRVASLKEGLSIEAANGRAMAASIDKQAKYLFGMNSTQLDAYMNSLKGVSTPAMTTSASSSQALTIKASANAENETDRLLKLFGWD